MIFPNPFFTSLFHEARSEELVSSFRATLQSASSVYFQVSGMQKGIRWLRGTELFRRYFPARTNLVNPWNPRASGRINNKRGGGWPVEKFVASPSTYTGATMKIWSRESTLTTIMYTSVQNYLNTFLFLEKYDLSTKLPNYNNFTLYNHYSYTRNSLTLNWRNSSSMKLFIRATYVDTPLVYREFLCVFVFLWT